jgi:hypothetical protein
VPQTNKTARPIELVRSKIDFVIKTQHTKFHRGFGAKHFVIGVIKNLIFYLSVRQR